MMHVTITFCKILEYIYRAYKTPVHPKGGEGEIFRLKSTVGNFCRLSIAIRSRDSDRGLEFSAKSCVNKQIDAKGAFACFDLCERQEDMLQVYVSPVGDVGHWMYYRWKHASHTLTWAAVHHERLMFSTLCYGSYNRS